MKSETTKLTIRLPRAHVEQAKAYARQHGLTVTELVDRHLRTLGRSGSPDAPAIAEITGLIPAEIDARAEYRAHLVKKHSK